RRIVHHPSIAIGIDHVAEVAVPHRLGWRGGVDRARALAVPEPFVRSEPEGFVPTVVERPEPDRPARGKAELIADELRWRAVPRLLAPRGQPDAVVAVGLERAPVEVVGAAAGRERDRSRARVARIGPDGLDAELLHGVEAGLDARDAAAEPIHQ